MKYGVGAGFWTNFGSCTLEVDHMTSQPKGQYAQNPEVSQKQLGTCVHIVMGSTHFELYKYVRDLWVERVSELLSGYSP